jgi:hypothetical protein
MKTKKFRNKLTLNKKTIAHLDMDKMKNAYGGVKETITCPITNTDCTCVNTCPNTCGDTCWTWCAVCPTECTCGTGVPFCPCASNDD